MFLWHSQGSCIDMTAWAFSAIEISAEFTIPEVMQVGVFASCLTGLRRGSEIVTGVVAVLQLSA